MSRISFSKKPRVSVVIPAFNAELFLERAVVSIQNQTEQDFEIIIVDDGSKDKTVTVGTSLAERDTRISVLTSELNRGPSHARNRAFKAARGLWIAHLDADDIYKPERLKTLVNEAERASLDMIADDIIYYDAVVEMEVGRGGLGDGSSLSNLTLDIFLQESMFRRRLTDSSPHPVLQYAMLKFVFRRSFIEEHNLVWPEAYRDNEDFMFYLSCLSMGARAALLPDAFYLYTERVGKISRLGSGMTRTPVSRFSAVHGVNELLGQSDNRFTRVQRRLLKRRRRQALGLAAFEKAFHLKHQNKIGSAFLCLLRQPYSWSFALQGQLQKLQTSFSKGDAG